MASRNLKALVVLPPHPAVRTHSLEPGPSLKPSRPVATDALASDYSSIAYSVILDCL